MVKTNVDTLADTTKSAIIVPVPGAEAIVKPYRRLLDHTVSWPVPAHVTVLYIVRIPPPVACHGVGFCRCLSEQVGPPHKAGDLSRKQYPLTQQGETGPPVALPLEHFHPIIRAASQDGR